MNAKARCIVILSTKSAGSTALQTLLCKFAGGRHVTHTRHGMDETLYWTKAASILGLPQIKVPDSEVPIPGRRAERELRQLLAQNAPGFAIPDDSEKMVFAGWRELCLRHAPLFIEKSPHHLHEWSALELLERAMRELPDIDHRFIGLIRNPMDYLYSAWERWRTPPEVLQHHWRIAHENLLKWRDRVAEKLIVVRYEDLAEHPAKALQLLEFLELKPEKPGADAFMRASSVLKWKADPRFGFQLDASIATFAQSLGYDESSLHNEPRAGWQSHRLLARAARQAQQPFMNLRRAWRHWSQSP